MPKRTDIKRVLVIGSGPIVIGQAAEFDYSGTQACRALRSEGLEVVLVNSNPADVVRLILFGKATYRKMVQNLMWATGYNAVAMPLAAGILYKAGILLSPAIGAVLMSLSTVVVAVNAGLLRVRMSHADALRQARLKEQKRKFWMVSKGVR